MSSEPAVCEPRHGLRERKKIALREQLRAIAIRQFAERGYDEVTVDDIAAAADVSPRTFYRYFASKEQVLLVQWEIQTQAVIETLRNRPADESPSKALQEAFLSKAALSHDELEVYYDWLTTLHSAPSVVESIQFKGGQFVMGLVAERMGLPDDDLRVTALVAATSAAVREANIEWMLSGGKTSLYELTRQVFSLLPRPPAAPQLEHPVDLR
jgi:AcrR family transcriptional regulator